MVVDLANLLSRKIPWSVNIFTSLTKFDQRMKNTSQAISRLRGGKGQTNKEISDFSQHGPLKHRRKKTAKNPLKHHKIYLTTDS